MQATAVASRKALPAKTPELMQGRGHAMAAQEEHTEVTSRIMGEELAVAVLPPEGAA